MELERTALDMGPQRERNNEMGLGCTFLVGYPARLIYHGQPS
jgi:hypothetical protein